jgi:hypothetical protein
VYLYPIEIVGITLALISLMALVITTAVANARLTRDRNYWRRWAMYTDEEKALSLADECECSESER